MTLPKNGSKMQNRNGKTNDYSMVGEEKCGKAGRNRIEGGIGNGIGYIFDSLSFFLCPGSGTKEKERTFEAVYSVYILWDYCGGRLVFYRDKLGGRGNAGVFTQYPYH